MRTVLALGFALAMAAEMGLAADPARATRNFGAGTLVGTVTDDSVRVTYNETGPNPTTETIIDEESDGGGAGSWIEESVCPWVHGNNKYKVSIKYKKVAKSGGGSKWKIKKGYPKATIKSDADVPAHGAATIDSSIGDPSTGLTVTITTTFSEVPNGLRIDEDFVYADNVVVWADTYGSAPTSERLDPSDYTATILNVDVSLCQSGALRYEVTYRVVVEALGIGHPDALVVVLQAMAFPIGEDPFPVAIEPTTIYDSDDA